MSGSQCKASRQFRLPEYSGGKKATRFRLHHLGQGLSVRTVVRTYILIGVGAFWTDGSNNL